MLGGGLLAHQGGWDEILLVVGPLALFAALLGLAWRRAGELEQPDGAIDTTDVESERET